MSLSRSKMLLQSLMYFYIQCLVYSNKLQETRKSKKNVTKCQERKQSGREDPEIIQMLELSDRDLKITRKKMLEDLTGKVDKMHEKMEVFSIHGNYTQETKF